jgi:arylsulfatase
LKGENIHVDRNLFWEHNKNRALRKGDWKLVAMKGKTWELYDLSKDRTEMNNLIEVEKELAEEMIGKYEMWAKNVGVKE